MSPDFKPESGDEIRTRQELKVLIVSNGFRFGAGMSVLRRGRFTTPELTAMARAVWNGKTIAESSAVVSMDGVVYFPESSLKREYFSPSSTTSLDPKKGQARYMNLLIDGQDNPDAAYYYPAPKPIARKIKGLVAFWRGVEIEGE